MVWERRAIWGGAKGLVQACALLAAVVGCATAETSPDGSKLIDIIGIEDGDVVYAIVQVEADVSKVGEVNGVQFYVDEARIDTVILAPFSTALDTREFADGEHMFRVVAATSSTESVETSITIRIDNSGPVVQMIEPVPTSALFYDGAEIALRFEAQDPSGVRTMLLTAGGVEIPLDGPPWVASFGLAEVGLSEDRLPSVLQLTISAMDGLYLESHTTFELTVQSRVAWKFDTLGEIWDPPAVAPDGSVYLGSTDETLYALSAEGVQRWAFPAGGRILKRPVLAANNLVIVSAGSSVHAVRAADGSVAWTAPVGTTIGTAAALGQDAVFVGTYGSGLVALSLSNGAQLWSYPQAGEVISDPAVHVDGTIIFGSNNGNIYGVKPDGSLAFEMKTGGEVWAAPLITADTDVVVGSNDGYLYRISRYGTPRVQFELQGRIEGRAAEAAGGMVYAATASHRRLYALTADLQPIWNHEFMGLGASSPVVASDGTIFIGAFDFKLYALDPQSGDEVWAFATGSTIKGSPVLSADETLVFVGSDDRTLYALYTGLVGCAAPEMVAFAGGAIMRYEASRADATSQEQGVRADVVCSRKDAVPWTDVTWNEARSACAAVGLDLCPAANWQAACVGPGGVDFPYGDSVQANACNGYGNMVGGCGAGACRAMTTGANPLCTSAGGASDMSGNVKEWSLDEADIGQYFVRGGSYLDDGDQLRCSNVHPTTHVLAGNSTQPDVGFRCCTPQP